VSAVATDSAGLAVVGAFAGGEGLVAGGALVAGAALVAGEEVAAGVALAAGEEVAAGVVLAVAAAGAARVAVAVPASSAAAACASAVTAGAAWAWTWAEVWVADACPAPPACEPSASEPRGADFFWPSAAAVRATWLSRTVSNVSVGGLPSGGAPPLEPSGGFAVGAEPAADVCPSGETTPGGMPAFAGAPAACVAAFAGAWLTDAAFAGAGLGGSDDDNVAVMPPSGESC
jgi:hypothetical protein